jgi:two-component system response regulator TctD
MRRPATTQAEIWQLGHVSIDIAARRINSREQIVEFGQREFCLLELLLSRAGQVVTKERLMMQLFNFDEDSSPNAVELHVSRLRRKLSDIAIRIDTVRGTGYMASLGDLS